MNEKLRRFTIQISRLGRNEWKTPDDGVVLRAIEDVVNEDIPAFTGSAGAGLRNRLLVALNTRATRHKFRWVDSENLPSDMLEPVKVGQRVRHRIRAGNEFIVLGGKMGTVWGSPKLLLDVVCVSPDRAVGWPPKDRRFPQEDACIFETMDGKPITRMEGVE